MAQRRYVFRRGFDRDTLANNVQAAWQNSPGVRYRLYLVLAVILGWAGWQFVTALWTIGAALVAA